MKKAPEDEAGEQKEPPQDGATGDAEIDSKIEASDGGAAEGTEDLSKGGGVGADENEPEDANAGTDPTVAETDGPVAEKDEGADEESLILIAFSLRYKDALLVVLFAVGNTLYY